MFIKKDTRRLSEMLDGVDEKNGRPRELHLSRRKPLFPRGSLSPLALLAENAMSEKDEKEQRRRMAFENIRAISIYDCGLSELAGRHVDSIARACTNLLTLDIGRNGIGVLPAEFAKLRALERLCCDDNSFETFPTAILGLKSLKALRISGNRIDALPRSLADDLPDLERLCVDRNQLAELPACVSKLGKLKMLSARGNRLRRLPDVLPAAIEELSCSSNEIEAFPENLIKSIPNVCKLYLNSNKIVGLSPALAALTSLIIANFSCNQIVRLPDELASWSGEKGIATLNGGALAVRLVGNPFLVAKRASPQKPENAASPVPHGRADGGPLSSGEKRKREEARQAEPMEVAADPARA